MNSTNTLIKLDNQQKDAACTTDGAILVLAVPGSGKTTTLISHINYMVKDCKIESSNILALTYTKSAAADMTHRYIALYGNDGVVFSTINSFCFRLVKNKMPFDMIDNSERSRVIKDIYRAIIQDYATENDVRTAETAISFAKNMMLTSEEIQNISIWGNSLGKVFDMYNERLNTLNKYDFDDQLIYAYKILKEDETLLNKYKIQYRYICLDEAQDTSKIQYEIIRLLSSGNIFMVGDEDQSIYGFRAAYPEGLLNFEKDYNNAKVYRLETNYRSTDEIISVASEFISNNKNRYQKQMLGTNRTGSPVSVIDVPSREEQYKNITEIVKSHDNSVAVLFRDNISMIPLIDEFLKNNISYNARKIEELHFFDDHVVEDIKDFLRLAINDKDAEAFKAIYNKCGAYIRKQYLTGICGKMYYNNMNVFDALHEWYSFQHKEYIATKFENKIKPMKHMKPADAITHIANNGYREFLSEKGYSIGYLDILKTIASDDNTIQEFFHHLDRLERELMKNNTTDGNVVLSTIHSSKGLEYDSVYIIDVFDSILPATLDGRPEVDSDKMYQEERRLFYVGMTRARNELNLFRITNQQTSFIDELFPSNGKKLTEIIKEYQNNTLVVRDINLNMLYKLDILSEGRFNAYEVNEDTGEIHSEHCNESIFARKDKNTWEIF